MAGKSRQTGRRPATKFPHLDKQQRKRTRQQPVPKTGKSQKRG